MSSRLQNANSHGRSRPLAPPQTLVGPCPSRVLSTLPQVRRPLSRAYFLLSDFLPLFHLFAPGQLRSPLRIRFLAPSAIILAERHSRPSGPSPSARTCLGGVSPPWRLAPCARSLGAGRGRLEEGPECLVTRTRSRVRSGPDMVRREPGPPGPAEFPPGASRRKPAPKCYRSIPAPGDPPRPGLSSRPAIRVEPDPGTTICSPSADRPARSCAMARSATPPELRPLKPDKPIPRRARFASRLATAMRASYHSSPLACPGLRRSSPSPPEPAPSPRSGQSPDRPVPGSQPTRPRSARPRRDRRVPPLPGTGPAPCQTQPRRGPARSTSLPPPPARAGMGRPASFRHCCFAL